jgi:hypothetical protein
VSVPFLADLREPPIPGRYYMVPVIDFTYCGKKGQWPTLGPLHHDKGDVGFEPLHFHVDFRFLTARQVNQIDGYYWGRPAEQTVAVVPLNQRWIDIRRKAYLAKRKCRVAGWKYTLPVRAPWMDKFDARYGAVAEPIRIKGGRLLCPHRKVDLSSFEPDADGIVTCPLHGLRVRCGGQQ